MRMTSKGQVTIPKHVREKLGVKPGDEIGFREEDGRMILTGETSDPEAAKRRAQLDKALKLIAEMRADGRIAPLGMSVDDYMDMLRGYSDDANDPGFKRHT